jgi:hypothetical protein
VINSADPDSSINAPSDNARILSPVGDCDKAVTTYITFDSFYENYIKNNGTKLNQLEIFNKIICNNLVRHPFLSDIVSTFREDVVEMWVQKFKEAHEVYSFVLPDPTKWVRRVEQSIFNVMLMKPIIEYMYMIGSLLVIFDVHSTFQLNKHMYKNIQIENIKPVSFKKNIYTAKELVDYHVMGKNISKMLIQELINTIHMNQNINSLNLDINLYNRIFVDTLLPVAECVGTTLQERVDKHILQEHHFPDILKQPVIYVDPDTHKVYIFEYHKLSSNFEEKNYINAHTGKPFDQEFIDQCLEKMKNINLCNYCKDNCTSHKTLRTIYQDPNFGPIVLKFCSPYCFSDIEWKPKAILNTIL